MLTQRSHSHDAGGRRGRSHARHERRIAPPPIPGMYDDWREALTSIGLMFLCAFPFLAAAAIFAMAFQLVPPGH